MQDFIKEIFENNQSIQTIIDEYNKMLEDYPTYTKAYIVFPEDKEGWTLRFPVYTYPRTGRISLEMIEDNTHPKLIEQIIKEACKGLLYIINSQPNVLPIIRQPIKYRYWQDDETSDIYLSCYLRSAFIPVNNEADLTTILEQRKGEGANRVN